VEADRLRLLRETEREQSILNIVMSKNVARHSDKRQIHCSTTELAAGDILSSVWLKMGFALPTRNALMA
jgi:hypothetical protein